MTHRQPARPTIYRARVRRRRVVGLLVVVAALAALSHGLPSSSSPTSSSSPAAASPVDPRRGEHRRAPSAPVGQVSGGATVGAQSGPLGEADGAVPDGTTVFDDGIPGVANLDPDLLAALRRAADDAARDGVQFVVDSGWRSRAYQEQLLQQAVSKYGSEAEAARWVATPETSAHVSGDAVDLGSGAAAWLSAHGTEYGLCQVYGNESWHYELRPEAVDQGCPAMYADAAHDPRMQQ